MRKKKTHHVHIVLLIAIAIVSTAIFATLFSACGDSCKSSSDKKLPCNIILISLDTLRADHMGIYRYHRDTTPFLDMFARESVVFENAYSQSPNTLVSHVTMITSLQPEVHETTPEYIMSDDFHTLAEYLKESGYKTAGFATHGSWLTREMGFAQGFDVFESDYRTAVSNNKLIFDYLEKNSDDRFFLFLHYYDIHSDYDKLPYWTGTEYDRMFCKDYKGNFTGCHSQDCASQFLDLVNAGKYKMTPEDVKYMEALYDGGIRYTDFQINRLFEYLKKRGLYDDSLIIITADHGEEFMEHGMVMHTQLYRECTHVPLIIKFPGKKEHKRISGLVGVIDIMPTILDYVKTQYKYVQGKSLLTMIEKGTEENRLVYSSFHGSQVKRKYGIISVRNTRYTLMSGNDLFGLELYDAVKDPKETINIKDTDPDGRKKCFKFARDYYDIQKKIRGVFRKSAKTKAKYSQKDMDKLKQLGYLN